MRASRNPPAINNVSDFFDGLANKPHCVFARLCVAARHSDTVMRHAGIDSIANSTGLAMSPTLTASLTAGEIGGHRALMVPMGEAQCGHRHFSVLIETGVGQPLQRKTACESTIGCPGQKPVALRAA